MEGRVIATSRKNLRRSLFLSLFLIVFSRSQRARVLEVAGLTCHNAVDAFTLPNQQEQSTERKKVALCTCEDCPSIAYYIYTGNQKETDPLFIPTSFSFLPNFLFCDDKSSCCSDRVPPTQSRAYFLMRSLSSSSYSRAVWLHTDS